jgi:hypothetical protein
MRVVFTGITGLYKERIAEAVALEAAKARGVKPDLKDHYTKNFIQVFSVEDEIKNTIGDLRPFLDQISKKERIRRWQEAMNRILQLASNSEHTILCFHNTFYRRSNFFSCVDWDLLCAYQPTVFITLINDIYDIWETINSREREILTNSFFHLPEILAWRSAETAATENLAENLYVKALSHGITSTQLATLKKEQANVASIFGLPVPHFVFAVKHSVKTLYQLLFCKNLPIVYASFPITKTRGDETGRTEIDEYRQRLFDSDFLTVLDPLTIDELRFNDSWKQGEQALRTRWPMKIGPPLVKEVALTVDPFEGYNNLQFDSFKNSVARSVEARDYQLISQSTILSAYRPFYGGPLGSGSPPSDAPSGGVDKELMFALEESKLIYAVHPEDDRKGGTKVFSSIDFAVSALTTDQLLLQLKKHQERMAKRFKKHEGKNTWETQ